MNEFEKQVAGQPLKSVPAEWRSQILNAARAKKPRAVPAFPAPLLAGMRELLWPSPTAWGALAAVWIVIAAFQLATPRAVNGTSVSVAKSRINSISEQRRELANLLDSPSEKSNRSPADRPRSARFVPQSFA